MLYKCTTNHKCIRWIGFSPNILGNRVRGLVTANILSSQQQTVISWYHQEHSNNTDKPIKINSKSTNNYKTKTSSNNHINKRTILNIENLCSSELWYWRLLPLSPWQVPVPSGPWPSSWCWWWLFIYVAYILNLVMVFIGPGRIGLSRGWYRHSSCDISRCW